MMSRHIDFALDIDEVKYCVLCGVEAYKPRMNPHQSESSGWYSVERVTPKIPNPIGGLVGVCNDCICHRYDEDFTRVARNEIIAKWRKTAPKFIQIIPRTPIHLVARGRCKDTTLAQAIRFTFGKILSRSRRKIVEYVCTHHKGTTTGKGLRFEALGRWQGMKAAKGMNMDLGHAIRLRASLLKLSSSDTLVGVIAHELAHTEQWADGARCYDANECERDVEERLRSWGFNAGPTERDRKAMVDQLQHIISLAKRTEAEIKNADLPSGNFFSYAVREAAKAASAINRSCDLWHGIKKA